VASSALAPLQYRLVCALGHEHICGMPQWGNLEGTPCIWCKQPIRLVEYRDEDGGLHRTSSYKPRATN
jgi:hypothetical protein